jgi:hypothetical protein
MAERHLAYLVALATLAILDWEGIGDLDGNPLPVSEPAIAALLNEPEVADAFVVQYVAKLAQLDQEKNVCAAAPAGILGAAAAIAATVPVPASHVPMAVPA